MNWWFGARWFGILGIPLSNNPFRNRILGIQTTRPQTNDLPLDDLTLKDLRDEMIETLREQEAGGRKRLRRLQQWEMWLLRLKSMDPPKKDVDILVVVMESFNRVSPEFLDRNGLVFVLYEKSLKSQIYFYNWWVDLKPPQ